MPWTRIDDQFHSHPKIIAAGSEGVALFVLALSWCGGALTDGFIPTAQVRRIALNDDATETAERLVTVGLWDRVPGGYQIHDYLDYNPSAEQVEAQRQAGIRDYPPDWESMRLTVLYRDNYRCRYCYHRADTVDHIIPYSRGGETVMGNLVAACRSCNSRKGARTPEEANMPILDILT
jgi:hypothetical protein